jgi:ABC-type cobalamin/Fe3+-siderophores transport system ATPase subunit
VIKVNSISIKEFRGIRDLTLDFQAKNFAICGPNGTGKSGVVDALEFVLTGNVSRLSGEGTGDLSLKEHGPHVDSRNNPDKARVSVNLTIPSLAKTVTLERSLKAPSIAHVTPSDASILEVLQHVKAHPEIALSRRELIRYVLATPGKRADEVQALLHLDRIEQVRNALQKIANTCEKQLPWLEAAAAQARESFLRTLDLSELSKDKVLARANTHRAILGLPALTEMTESTSLKDGMAAPLPVQPQRIPKTQALIDIQASRDALRDIAGALMLADEVRVELGVLAADPAVSANVKRESFYATGIELIEAEACPFCDTTWDPIGLKRHIEAKIGHLEQVSLKRKALESKLAPLLAYLHKAQASINTLIRYAGLSTKPVPVLSLRTYSATCATAVGQMTSFLPLADTITVLTNVTLIPQSVTDAIADFEKMVTELPEPTKQDAAREWLTVAQERLDVWRDAMRKKKVASERAQTSRQVSDLYAKASDIVLESIYKDVEKDFAALYSFVNRDDEEKFSAQLVPSIGKLGFDVDFYGRGFFPPGAYHSEGHQDGMGLCLYLALMRHLQKDQFTFAVLDDVLMSVDAAHRREVCTLLKTEFPNTQFIMTTHDPIWLRHMSTEGVIGGRVQFKSWNVDEGPTQWDERDVWTEIEDQLAADDVRAAAALLRHYLEYMSAELCYRLHAPVGLRGDAHYQLGELLPSAISHLRNLLKRAKEAANSWNQKEMVEQLVVWSDEFSSLANSTNVEQWQVNVAVHFNSWDNLGKEDFRPVVQVFRDLLAKFACPDCDEYLRVSPDREMPEIVRCGCGKTNMNLKKKGT